MCYDYDPSWTSLRKYFFFFFFFFAFSEVVFAILLLQWTMNFPFNDVRPLRTPSSFNQFNPLLEPNSRIQGGVVPTTGALNTDIGTFNQFNPLLQPNIRLQRGVEPISTALNTDIGTFN